MDIQTIDSQYSQLQGQADQTVQSLKGLATKLQTAAQAGNPDAREWMLDLKEIALAIQAEQNQVANLLQALHGFVANQPQQMGSVPQTQQPWGTPQQQNYPPQGYPPQQGYPQQQGYPPQQQGGILGGFLNSGFGRAITMGAGFGIGDSIINDIF
jgi:hypothetical protein